MGIEVLNRLSLYDWQVADVHRLSGNTSNLITWDMGLGKTRLGIALDLSRRELSSARSLKTLIICPSAACYNVWAKSLTELAPHLSFTVLDPKTPDTRMLSMVDFHSNNKDVLIIPWSSVITVKQLKDVNWLHIIADEAHRICERKTQTSIIIKTFPAVFKTAMTGTPTDGRPDKMWSILNWLYPKKFKAYHQFKNYFGLWATDYNGYESFICPQNLPELHETIAPFYSVHFKRRACCENHPQGVGSNLPPAPIFDELRVKMYPKQAKMYADMHKDWVAWLNSLEHDNLTPLQSANAVARLMRLQQFAASTMEFIGDEPRMVAPSIKVDTIMDLLKDNANEKIAIYSQFSQMIYMIAQACEKAKIPGSMVVGGQSMLEREAEIDYFTKFDGRVFLGTIRAGGEAIDGLQIVSNTLIFTDRDWNPGWNEQVIGRLDRNGQTTRVQVIDILTDGTIDLGRKTKIETKAGWLKEVLGGIK